MGGKKPGDILFAAEQIVFDLIHRPVEPVPDSVKAELEELYRLITDDKILFEEVGKSVTLLKAHYFELVEAVKTGEKSDFESAFNGMEEWIGPLELYSVDLRAFADNAFIKTIDILSLDGLPKKAEEKIIKVKDLLYKICTTVKEVPSKIGALSHLVIRLELFITDPKEAENFIASAGKLINFIDQKINATS